MDVFNSSGLATTAEGGDASPAGELERAVVTVGDEEVRCSFVGGSPGSVVELDAIVASERVRQRFGRKERGQSRAFRSSRRAARKLTCSNTPSYSYWLSR